MKKQEYIDFLSEGILNKDVTIPYLDVVECVYLALSEETDDFEVAKVISVEELWNIISNKLWKEKLMYVGPFVVAEIFAKELGANYIRPSKKLKVNKLNGNVVILEDFI